MASALIAGGGGENGVKQRYSETKVYTRKVFKARKKINTVSATASATVSTTTTINNEGISSKNGNTIAHSDSDVRNFNNDSNQALPRSGLSEDGNLSQQQASSRPDAVLDDSSPLNQPASVGQAAVITEDPLSGNGIIKTGLDNQSRINWAASRPKQEMLVLRRKFEGELEMVRNLVKRIEDIQGQYNIGRSYSRASTMEVVDNSRRENHAHSEVGSVGVLPGAARRSNQLSISVLGNSKGASGFMEREKRTPKANQFYRNSEFLLAKDRIPPAESNKRSRSHGKRTKTGTLKHGFGMGTKLFSACISLLEKLMNHKHGWVFNSPVDVEGLGLHDYFSIVRHPMDLGTVKSRLINKNWYKSPEEFAEDVRLTFHNAMAYNPVGQDVHIMAGQLLEMFEERWARIESGYYQAMKLGIEYGASLPTPTSRRAPPLPLPPLDMKKILERSDSMLYSANSKAKLMSVTPPARTPSLKKPKASDSIKRDMTYIEKQKLSTNLQSLPSEKLDAILQIIKKRNSELLQQDDEIEVDIDTVDTETLWELDRLVTNYRKNLSKNKRRAELAILKAQAESERNIQEKIPASEVTESQRETRADERIVSSLSPIQGQEDQRSKSSSSSSSSSDSGSSSSDSDSESSSLSGSDAG